MNFHSAAFTYLYEWVYNDRQFRKTLSFTSPEPQPKKACDELIAVAKHYDIIRNFKLENGSERLLPAWHALKDIQTPPTSGDDAKELVGRFVTSLRPTYGKDLWSAASKFLWMRFGTPIVIYDSITWKWMCDHVDCPRNGSYHDFYDRWQISFSGHRDEIRAVCEEFKKTLSPARKFFDRDDEIGEKEFDEAITSNWFAERVFDHAMLNASLPSIQSGV